MSCQSAQHAHHLIDRTGADVARLERLLYLLAAELDVDLDELTTLDDVDRRGGYVVTFFEQQAVARRDGAA